jgi:hypothetical protein
VKTELRHVPHSQLPGEHVLELWHDGKFIGTVAGADGPGVRVISKHAITAEPQRAMVMEIRIEPGASPS